MWYQVIDGIVIKFIDTPIGIMSEETLIYLQSAACLVLGLAIGSLINSFLERNDNEGD